MLNYVRRLWRGDRSSLERIRKRLVRRYPNHLDLIDSLKIPHDYAKGPDLAFYSQSAQYYFELIVDSAGHMKDTLHAAATYDRGRFLKAYNRMMNSVWGLIARGSESIPFAIRLLTSGDQDQQVAASHVFCGFRDPKRVNGILEYLHGALESGSHSLAFDSTLIAIGALRSRKSIGVLARLVVDESRNDDTRGLAARSLGKVVRKRFEENPNGALKAACDWVKANRTGM